MRPSRSPRQGRPSGTSYPSSAEDCSRRRTSKRPTDDSIDHSTQKSREWKGRRRTLSNNSPEGKRRRRSRSSERLSHRDAPSVRVRSSRKQKSLSVDRQRWNDRRSNRRPIDTRSASPSRIFKNRKRYTNDSWRDTYTHYKDPRRRGDWAPQGNSTVRSFKPGPRRRFTEVAPRSDTKRSVGRGRENSSSTLRPSDNRISDGTLPTPGTNETQAPVMRKSGDVSAMTTDPGGIQSGTKSEQKWTHDLYFAEVQNVPPKKPQFRINLYAPTFDKLFEEPSTAGLATNAAPQEELVSG